MNNKEFNSKTEAREVIDKNHPESLQGRIVIVTGSNSGIGYSTALEFYRKGAVTIMACRTKSKMEEAKKQILEEAEENSNGGVLELMTLDLGSLRSVNEFVTEFKQKYNKLHTLILNAGLFHTPFSKTEEGIEMQVGTNHFGHFALTNLLLPLMTDVEDPRIISVASFKHAEAMKYLDLEDLNYEKRPYHKDGAYCVSKFFNVLFIAELQRLLVKSGHSNITVYAVDPGMVKTAIANHEFITRTIVFLLTWFLKSPQQGAATTMNCATNPAFKEKSGKYFSDCQEKEPIPQAKDPQLARQLWELSEKLTNTSYPL
jgi:NAD(P)-dependent dehydrogenase (short-subunit alcohol dehydrogenase family)